MRILGIDFGSSSIKAVEMDSAFGRYEIHDYHECALSPDKTSEEAALQLIQNLPRAPDRIIVPMKSGQATFRSLFLPTRSKKVVHSSIGFELEDELPFPMDDSLYDYTILSQSKAGSTIHAAATLKRHVFSTIENCEKSEIDADVISTEAWAYRVLMNRVLGTQAQEAPVLLAQLGHEKTTFYLHWRGAPALVREMAWGGKTLTTAICTRFGIPWDQAETQKLSQGFIQAPKARTPAPVNVSPEINPTESPKNPGNAPVLSEVTPEQIELSQCLETCLAVLVTELRQIELMCRNVTHHSVSTIYLAGGTSLLPGLAPWLQATVKTPTKPVQALSSITPSGVTYSDQTDARFILAASLALSQIGPNRTMCINFRKGDFAKEAQSSKMNLSILKKPAIAIGAVACSLFLSLVIQSSVYKSQLNKVNAQLERSTRSFFGQISSGGLRTYLSDTALLRSSINKELNKQKELNRLFGQNAKSPLNFLNTLSTTVTKDIVVDMIQFSAGSPAADPFPTGPSIEHTTSLTFLVSNPQTAEKLATSLGGRIGGIQRGKMEEVSAPDGSKKWKITFSGKLNEESYGK